MGSYSVLNIGKEELVWKYDIPSYLSFLFKKEDFYQNQIDEDSVLEIGYQTTCEKAILKLNQLSFDWEMISQVYSFFYEQLKDNVENNIKELIGDKYDISNDLELESKVKAYLNKYPKLSREDELKDFTSFFIPLLNASRGVKGSLVKSIDGKTYKLIADSYNPTMTIQGLEDVLFDKALKLPPWILIIGNLFTYDILQEYSDIISVVQIKLLLESHNSDTLIKLDLSDIIEDENEIEDFHIESAKNLVEKINLNQKFFTGILNQEEALQNIFFKKKVNTLINDFTKLKKNDKNLKGKNLEELMEILFSSINGLDIINKRMSNGDEEIDLIIQNNINQTFWSSLASPCFFVECKNWSTKVGSKEIRDFEIKMRNHRRLVKIGFFISYNGFTREVITELKRSSRDEFHIVIIDGKDINELVSSNLNIIKWLEKLITNFY